MPQETPIDRLAKKRAKMLKQREQLQAELFDLDQRIDELPHEEVPAGPPSDPVQVGGSRGRPLRAAMLDALEGSRLDGLLPRARPLLEGEVRP